MIRWIQISRMMVVVVEEDPHFPAAGGGGGGIMSLLPMLLGLFKGKGIIFLLVILGRTYFSWAVVPVILLKSLKNSLKADIISVPPNSIKLLFTRDWKMMLLKILYRKQYTCFVLPIAVTRVSREAV